MIFTPPHFPQRAALERVVAKTYHVAQAACLRRDGLTAYCILSDGTVVKVVCKLRGFQRCESSHGREIK